MRDIVPARIVIRADAARRIGSGHVIRCLTLADALRAFDCTTTFVCREHEGHFADLIESRGHAVCRLPAREDPTACEDTARMETWLGCSWRDDARETAEAVAATAPSPDWLIVDHYGLDWRWQGALRSVASRIMVIDDLANRTHDCDALLDQNLITGFRTRYADKVPRDCVQLLGPTYALLQPAYGVLRDATEPRDGPIERIFVFFSAGDLHDLAGRTLDAFLELDRPDIHVDVVIGAGSPKAADVRSRARGHANIEVHEPVPTLASLIARADLAVGASGSTTWERLCLGVHSIIVTLAANQRPVARELDRLGLAQWIGDEASCTHEQLRLALEHAIAVGRRRDLAIVCRDLVDGRGAHRVSRLLLDARMASNLDHAAQ